jgi:hypothetical protein
MPSPKKSLPSARAGELTLGSLSSGVEREGEERRHVEGAEAGGEEAVGRRRRRGDEVLLAAVNPEDGGPGGAGLAIDAAGPLRVAAVGGPRRRGGRGAGAQDHGDNG